MNTNLQDHTSTAMADGRLLTAVSPDGFSGVDSDGPGWIVGSGTIRDRDTVRY